MKEVIKVTGSAIGGMTTELNGPVSDIQTGLHLVMKDFIDAHPDKEVAKNILRSCLETAIEK